MSVWTEHRADLGKNRQPDGQRPWSVSWPREKGLELVAAVWAGPGLLSAPRKPGLPAMQGLAGRVSLNLHLPLPNALSLLGVLPAGYGIPLPLVFLHPHLCPLNPGPCVKLVLSTSSHAPFCKGTITGLHGFLLPVMPGAGHRGWSLRVRCSFQPVSSASTLAVPPSRPLPTCCIRTGHPRPGQLTSHGFPRLQAHPAVPPATAAGVPGSR